MVKIELRQQIENICRYAIETAMEKITYAWVISEMEMTLVENTDYGFYVEAEFFLEAEMFEPYEHKKRYAKIKWDIREDVISAECGIIGDGAR